MQWLSKYIVKINNQLMATMMAIVVGILIVFGGVLPNALQYFIHEEMYHRIVEEQKNFVVDGETIEGHNGIYHYVIEGGRPKKDLFENSPEMIHHLMMYPEFFHELFIKEQSIKVGEHYTNAYQTAYETIYYVIYKSSSEEAMASYSVDNTSEMVVHEIFMSTLVIGIGIFFSMLLIFLKWTKRLIGNLRDIQGILDTIEADNLHEEIVTDSYTVEIQEVMASLDRMRGRLLEEDRIKQQMLHNMSHDFKTPLAVIKNYAEGITDGVYPYGTLEDTAHIIYKQAERLEKKVQGLLYLNRLDYISTRSEEGTLFDMGELIEEVVNYMKDPHVSYRIKMNVSPTLFKGEVEKWRIVIENLIDNAKRYVKDEIKIEVSDGQIQIYNDGECILEPLMGKLFQPFEKGKDGITGLGLAIVKKTVELYGYHIEVKNEEKGVRFIIS